MDGWPLRRDRETDRRFDLAAARARERVDSAFAEAVADLVDGVLDTLPIERAVPVALRLLRVEPRRRDHVSARALALLSERHPMDRLLELEADRRRWHQRLRERVRGRQRHELRERLGRLSARGRRRVRRDLIRNVRDVVVAVSGAMSQVEALERGLNRLQVGPGWRDEIFHLALSDTEPTTA